MFVVLSIVVRIILTCYTPTRGETNKHQNIPALMFEILHPKSPELYNPQHRSSPVLQIPQHPTYLALQNPQCVAGRVVSLLDCHAVDPGSIPGLNT